jgi:hypothetical protein
MGCLMQTSTLIAQNSIELRDIGAGTGVATFLRNMGSSLGVALLGAIYTSSLTNSLSGPSAATGNQMTPAILRELPEAARHTFQVGVTDALGMMFMVAAVIAAAGIVIALFVRQVPLRGRVQAEDTP